MPLPKFQVVEEEKVEPKSILKVLWHGFDISVVLTPQGQKLVSNKQSGIPVRTRPKTNRFY